MKFLWQNLQLSIELPNLFGRSPFLRNFLKQNDRMFDLKPIITESRPVTRNIPTVINTKLVAPVIAARNNRNRSAPKFVFNVHVDLDAANDKMLMD